MSTLLFSLLFNFSNSELFFFTSIMLLKTLRRKKSQKKTKFSEFFYFVRF